MKEIFRKIELEMKQAVEVFRRVLTSKATAQQ